MQETAEDHASPLQEAPATGTGATLTPRHVEGNIGSCCTPRASQRPPPAACACPAGKDQPPNAIRSKGCFPSNVRFIKRGRSSESSLSPPLPSDARPSCQIYRRPWRGRPDRSACAWGAGPGATELLPPCEQVAPSGGCGGFTDLGTRQSWSHCQPTTQELCALGKRLKTTEYTFFTWEVAIRLWAGLMGERAHSSGRGGGIAR